MSVKPPKGYVGIGMEGFIATSYARNTKNDIKRYWHDAQLIARQLAPGSNVLEVAPGPGYLSIELARLGDFHLTGLDISQTFVEIAQQQAREAGVTIDFRLGNASAMPFGDNTFDFVVCRAAFKNFSEPVGALNEMYRVLKPEGKALVIDLRADAAAAEISRHAESMGLSWFQTQFTVLALKSLKKRAYTETTFRQVVAQSAFKRCEVHPDEIGMAIWLRKSLSQPAGYRVQVAHDAPPTAARHARHLPEGSRRYGRGRV